MDKENKKWFNFETVCASIKDELRKHLKLTGIYYELSKAHNAYHFEILCADEELKQLDIFLDYLYGFETETRKANINYYI